MADEMKKDNLFRHMAHMVALEADVQQSLQPLLTNAHPGIAALAAQIQSSTSGQGPALAARLADVAGDDIPNAEFEDPLGHLHRTVIETLIGYSKMQVLARRYAHGSPTPEGATDDLGHQNSANHIKAFQDIYQLLHDVMLWELDHDGHSCQCPYPCCSHGICLCAVSSRAVQRGAWGDGEAVKEAGVFVHSPARPGCATATWSWRLTARTWMCFPPCKAWSETMHRAKRSISRSGVVQTVPRNFQSCETRT